MISALGEWDPITPVLNSLVLELIFFFFELVFHLME